MAAGGSDSLFAVEEELLLKVGYGVVGAIGGSDVDFGGCKSVVTMVLVGGLAVVMVATGAN